MKHTKLIVAFIILSAAFSFVFSYVRYWMQFYPQYLLFQDRYRFQNSYYTLALTSFITDLELDRHNIAAYWRIFTLEENYQGKWNLEIFDKRWQENTTVIWTMSHTFTENIVKRWQFWKDQPTFTVEITRTYQINAENMNNQIIIDINNKAIHQIPQGIIYQTETGIFGYRILEANPNNITIQTGHPTETQLNFYGASDRTLRYHSQGETETVKLLVYANQFGSVDDAW